MSNIENKEIPSTISETPTPVKDKLVTAESLKLVSDIAKTNRTETTKLKEDIVGVESSKISKPTQEQNGKTPRALNGEVEWVPIGLPTTEQTNTAVTDWLGKHPEATTTVQDGSLTLKKIKIGELGYVTPEMFGAVGDGIHDDTSCIQNAVNYASQNGVKLLITKPPVAYKIGTIILKSNVIFEGVSRDLCVFKTYSFGITTENGGRKNVKDIIIRNITVDCENIGNYGIRINTGISAGITQETAEFVEDVVVENCKVLNSKIHNIAVWQSAKNVIIKNCVSVGGNNCYNIQGNTDEPTDAENDSVLKSFTHDIKIINCVGKNSKYAVVDMSLSANNVLFDDCLFASGNLINTGNIPLFIIGYYCENVMIKNCTFDGYNSPKGTRGINITDRTNSIIDHCTFINSKSDSIWSGNSFKRCTIKNSIIDKNILMSLIDSKTNLTIMNNDITGIISMTGVKNSKICGNKVKNSDLTVHFVSNNDNIEVYNNFLETKGENNVIIEKAFNTNLKFNDNTCIGGKVEDRDTDNYFENNDLVIDIIRFGDTKFFKTNKTPSSGTFTKNDIAWNNDFKSNNVIGWVCIESGSPGIWKSFGSIL